jgi:Ca-activated chloride channel family protein
LWLLAIPALLVAWQLTQRGPRVALPLDNGRQRTHRWLGHLLTLIGSIPALLLAIAILIAAAPLRPTRPEAVRELTNVEFVLDVSGSMASSFTSSGSRYDAAMAAINAFTHHRQGDAFGLTIFGNEVLRWTPLTQDTSAIDSATPFLRPESLPGHFGGTEIGKAVLFCGAKLAERGTGDRLLILISDGESSDLGDARSREIGSSLAEENIVLYTVHIGDGSPPQQIVELVRPTGGRVFAARDPRGLATIFDHIDQMQPTKLKPAASLPVYFYQPFALLGLVLVGLQAACALGLRYTPW